MTNLEKEKEIWRRLLECVNNFPKQKVVVTYNQLHKCKVEYLRGEIYKIALSLVTMKYHTEITKIESKITRKNY